MAAQKALPAMLSGRVIASLSPAMVRAFSRSKIAASKRGACSTVRSISSAASRFSADASVRTATLARSVSAPPPSVAPMSAICSAIAVSSSLPAPRPRTERVSAALPDFPGGSNIEPAAKSTCTSRMGRTRLSTKKMRAPVGDTQFSIFTPASAEWVASTAMIAVNSFFMVISQWRVATEGRRGLPSSGCGSRTPTVSVSSMKYFFATACT